MTDDKKDMLDQVAEDLITDPDAPEHGHTAPPPQTVGNESPEPKRS